LASQINASNSGFGGIVSTGDSSGVLELQTTGTTAVTIDTSQRVGIGTTSPAITPKLTIQSTVGTNSYGGIRLLAGTSNANQANYEAFGRRSDGNIASSFSGGVLLARVNTAPAAITTGMNIGRIAFGGSYDGTDANVVYGSQISGISEGTYSSTSAPTGLAFYTTPSGTAGALTSGTGEAGSERMRIDSSGNVGINNSNPAQFDTSGEVLNISGAAANTNPSVLFMAGNGGGAGYNATEVFAIAGITAATEITRNTGTGANGFRAYLKVTVTGHSGGVGNGINIKEFYWDGGTGAPVQISTYTNGSVPVISFDNTTSNVWIVKLASSNGTASFNGVMKVEWLMPVDFASSTWTIS
jgi:hypothetical protein